MKRGIYIKSLFTFIIIACGNEFESQQFNQIDIVSSKGEHIYISTLNSGVTGDKQFTLISDDKILNGDDFDKTKSLKGLDPFIYSFSNNQLNLYFRNDIRYQVPFKPKSIKVQYFVLNNSDYVELYKKPLITNNIILFLIMVVKMVILKCQSHPKKILNKLNKPFLIQEWFCFSHQ